MRTIHHTRSSRCAALLFLALAASSAAIVQAEPPREDVSALLDKLEDATPRTRPLVARELMLLGERGLRETRAARDREQRPDLKRTLTRIATWQLARKITPLLRERYETGLRFDGQYKDLKDEGAEVVGALLFLVNEEASFPGDGQETHARLRLASCRALADVASEKALPLLRRMYHDPLLLPVLMEEIGVLMAIFGDTYAVDHEISRLEELISQGVAQVHLRRNERLSELYYQIRDYSKAVACYDRILVVYERHYRAAGRRNLDPLFIEVFALRYYNAACSRTLNGDIEKAKELLRKCIKLDASHFENLAKDGDFSKLRSDDSYGEFRKALRKLLPRESF